MDTTKIIKAIQIIVKEEIKKEMVKQKKAIRESILKEIKSASAKSQPTQVEKDPLDIDHIFEQTKLPKKQVFKSTGFADLLNETADRGEWRSINGNGGSFGTNAAAAWGRFCWPTAQSQIADALDVALLRTNELLPVCAVFDSRLQWRRFA